MSPQLGCRQHTARSQLQPAVGRHGSAWAPSWHTAREGLAGRPEGFCRLTRMEAVENETRVWRQQELSSEMQRRREHSRRG